MSDAWPCLSGPSESPFCLGKVVRCLVADCQWRNVSSHAWSTPWLLVSIFLSRDMIFFWRTALPVVVVLEAWASSE